MDAASHIAEEIERTRLHLANLEQALEGLKPLMTIDVSMTTLSYRQVGEVLPVEDAFIVHATKTKTKAARAPKAVKRVAKVEPKATIKVDVANKSKPHSAAAKPAGIASTGATFWMKCAGRKAFSSGDLTDAALAQLSLDASAKGILANRARAWITASLKQGVLLTAGTRDGINLYKRA